MGSGNTVNYNRDSAFVFLNRVIGSDPSNIFGSINAVNGKLFLINQNGILFAPGSSVNAAGLTASTLDIKDADFLAGRYTFFGKGGSVVNRGFISAPGGFVALLGSTVENAGVIEARLGKVILASGERITLGLDPQDVISVVIDEETTQNLEGKDDAVRNIGKITADGGKVILTAKTLDGIFKRAVNNEGIVEAKSLAGKKGEVYLLGNMENDLVANTGTIDVSASESGADGGFVELSAARVIVDGDINVSSIDGKAGELFIDPWDLHIVTDTKPWWGAWNNPNVYYGELAGYVKEAWLENFDGNLTLQAVNDVLFELNDNQLNLSLINSGETFLVEAGRHIQLNNDSIVTQGGNINLSADTLLIPVGGNVNLGTGAGLKSNGGDITLKGVDINLTASVDAGTGNVNIRALNNINDDNNNATRITANDLDMAATLGSIGSSTARIDTEVNSITAKSLLGSVYINEASGVTLNDVSALGSTVDVITNGLTYINNVSANGLGASDPAIVNLVNNGGRYFCKRDSEHV